MKADGDLAVGRGVGEVDASPEGLVHTVLGPGLGEGLEFGVGRRTSLASEVRSIACISVRSSESTRSFDRRSRSSSLNSASGTSSTRTSADAAPANSAGSSPSVEISMVSFASSRRVRVATSVSDRSPMRS